MATPGKITTTLVIQFTDPAAAGAGYQLSAEIDSRPDGLNKGVTSFIFGDSPGFLVYYSSGVSISNMQSSAGGISSAGTSQVEVVEFVTFANTREASLSKPPSGGVSFVSMGGSAGAPSVSGSTCTLSSPAVAVFQATYFTTGHGHRLTGVSKPAGVSELPVVIYIEGTTPPT